MRVLPVIIATTIVALAAAGVTLLIVKGSGRNRFTS